MQVTNSHSSSPAARNAKSQAKIIHELEPHMRPEEYEPEPTPKTHQPTRSASPPAIPQTKLNSSTLKELKAQDKLPGQHGGPDSDSDSDPPVTRQRTPGSKSNRCSQGSQGSQGKARILRELKGHNKSPERDIGSKHKGRRRKRLISKPRPSSRISSSRSQLLREIADYNKPPETEDRHGSAMAPELEVGLRQKRLTRGARESLMHVAKNGTPKIRRSLNVKTLMEAEFNGEGQGTKRFQSEGSGDLSRHKKQRKEMTGLFVGEEDDDGEETLENFSKTHDGDHSQSTPTRQLSPSQTGNVAGSTEHDDEFSAESAWSYWDSRKG